MRTDFCSGIFRMALTVMPAIAVLCSCVQSGSNKNESHSKERNNIERRELTYIDDGELPLIHGEVPIYMYGDTLIISDSRSRDYIFYAYDVVKGRYVGGIGKYGAGPGEIANFGMIGIDRDSGMLYGADYNKWKVIGFDIAQALSDSTYHPVEITKFPMEKDGFRSVNRTLYVNDSTVYCAVVIANPGYRGAGYYLGRFDLHTAKAEVLDTINPDPYSGLMCLDPAGEGLIEFSLNYDRIRFFDFDGKLRHTVYGPDYQDRRPGVFYYGRPVVVGERIYVPYANDNFRNPDVGHHIVVMDLEGNYIKSIDVGVRVEAVAYNPTTRRLYVSTWGEPQFGYLEIED